MWNKLELLIILLGVQSRDPTSDSKYHHHTVQKQPCLWAFHDSIFSNPCSITSPESAYQISKSQKVRYSGLTRANYPKANNVVPARRKILDPGRATQTTGKIAPGTAAQRTGKLFVCIIPILTPLPYITRHIEQAFGCRAIRITPH